MKRMLIPGWSGVRYRLPVSIAQTSTWVPDKAHSEIDFTVLHLGISNVHGNLGNIGGTIVVNDPDITKSTINITIDVSSVDTGVSMRDNDLKSDHFFDVAQFPTATFVSTAVAKSGDRADGNGNLTLHGVTKPVTLDRGRSDRAGAGHGQKAPRGLRHSIVSRTAFGIGAGMPTSCWATTSARTACQQ